MLALAFLLAEALEVAREPDLIVDAVLVLGVMSLMLLSLFESIVWSLFVLEEVFEVTLISSLSNGNLARFMVSPPLSENIPGESTICLFPSFSEVHCREM